MALITADNSTSLGRPPGFAAGSSSLKNSYCSRLRSLGYDLLISLSRCCIGLVFTAYRRRAFLQLFHLFKQPLRDNEAYKSDVIQNLHHTNLLHIACHGIFDSDNPFNSGLVLIPDGKAIDILSLKDLSSLFLNELLHVTLSSCWTADHFVLPGRWVISLPETLWRSGVSSILSCRWEVYDKVAIYFMRRFYENLASHPRDEALRQTQLEFIRQPSLIPEKTKERLNLANPLFWSGFSLYGNFYTLSLPKKINRTS